MRTLSSTNVRRFAAACPVTTGIIVVAAGLWLATEVWGWRLPKGAEEAQGRLGSVIRFAMTLQQAEGEPKVPVPQMHGPFELWEGQWWRVPISGFHHVGILHLLMNSSALIFFGWLLEPRMGKLSYPAFFLSATAISVLPEYLLEHYAVGLSGAAYALFGVLLVLRHRDWQVAEAFTPAMVQFGLLWLVGCIVATELDFIHIANVAHIAGLLYGWLAGQVLFGRFAAQPAVRWLFVAAHFVLVPGFYFVSHPFWVGRYQWYLAYQEEQHDRKAAFLQKAIERDPSLRRAWDQLSLSQWQHNEQDQAWRIVLEGLRHNRSNEHGMQLAQIYWQTFVIDNQDDAARKVVTQVFGDDAPSWQQRLEEPPRESISGDLLATELWRNLIHARDQLMRRIPVFPDRRPMGKKGDLSAPPVDPDAPQSAAEGVQL